jgi:hypothetical protein
MVAAPGEEDVLTKTDVVGVVMRNVDEKPEPPCVAIFAAESRLKARRMAGSIDGGISNLFTCGNVKNGSMVGGSRATQCHAGESTSS